MPIETKRTELTLADRVTAPHAVGRDARLRLRLANDHFADLLRCCYQVDRRSELVLRVTFEQAAILLYNELGGELHRLFRVARLLEADERAGLICLRYAGLEAVPAVRRRGA